jgi:hypothetical protein
MCDSKCCNCAYLTPPWWVTMGFVPPNINQGNPGNIGGFISQGNPPNPGRAVPGSQPPQTIPPVLETPPQLLPNQTNPSGQGSGGMGSVPNPLNLLPGLGNPLGQNTGGTGIGPNQSPNQGSNTSAGNIIGDFLNPIGALSHLL